MIQKYRLRRLGTSKRRSRPCHRSVLIHTNPVSQGRWSYAIMSSEVIIKSSKTRRMANTGWGHGAKSRQIKKKGRITGTSQKAAEESTPVVKSKP